MSLKPLTMAQAEARKLVAPGGIHTFSNGTEWECWASGNCLECWHYDPETVGQCAFEGAALMHIVTPELARLFGWKQHTQEYGEKFGWDAPEQCACFRSREDSDGNDNPPPPDPDPTQLVLLADPTEDASTIMRSVHVKEPAHV